MFQPFSGTLVRPIDGDSVVVQRNDGKETRVRVGGVDVQSRGYNAQRAISHIRVKWVGQAVDVRPTANYLVHGEIPGIVTMAGRHNLGEELLAFGRRLPQFPIRSQLLPNLANLAPLKR